MNDTTKPPGQKKHLPWFLEPQPAPSAGCCSFLAAGVQELPVSGVLEDESIKDVTCDSDGAQELCLVCTKGSIPPLDHQKPSKKSPKNPT